MNSNPVEERKLQDALASCCSEVRESLEAARDGAELSFEQGLLLTTAGGANLAALVAVADELRRAAVGETISYVVYRNIDLTTSGSVGCSFCGTGHGAKA